MMRKKIDILHSPRGGQIRQHVGRFLTPERILVLSFALFILAGAATLKLPQAVHGLPLTFLDALFTATSATCVTGLIVVDTATKFTTFGQWVILVMIQLGGLGIMTFSTAFLYLLGGRISLTGRDLLQESLSQGPTHYLRGLLKTVLLATFGIEFLGAVLLTVRFLPQMPVGKAVYFGVFHSISAFCNAGFALFSENLIPYRDDAVVCLTIAALIILGGLGFVVLFELQRFGFSRQARLSLHARLVLATTALLIAGGAVLFFVFESRNAIEFLPWKSKILAAVFQSVTARTAGFNTLDFGKLSNSSLFFIIVLMFIGASPASCAGGIKTTTFAVIVSQIRSRFHGHEDTNLFYRQIPSRSVSKAITVTFFSAAVILIFTTFLLSTELGGISHQESRGQFLELLFEVTSAFGTVGLSTGVTPTLSVIGRLLITVVMFLGRLGPLTVVMAVGRQQEPPFKYVEEDVLIG